MSSYLDAVDPSVELVCLLAGMHGDVDLDVDGRIAAVAGWERVISWATALQGELLVAADQDDDIERWGWGPAEAARSLCEQLGLALRVSGGSAVRRVNTATALVEKAPAVHDALKRGAVTVHHARVAATAVAPVPVEIAQQVAAAAMTDDAWRTPAQFGDTFARLVLELDPDGAAQRHRAARRGRRVSRRSEPECMGSLWALLPAEDNEEVYQRIDACARSSSATNVAGDERTLDERRADALVQLVCGQIPNGYRGSGTRGATGEAGATAAPASEPTRHGRRVTVHVTVAWSTLIGLDDAPAYLAGYGHVDAVTARRICANPAAVWYRLLTDPVSGRLLDFGRTVYRPPQDLCDFVMARDRCCRFPGCERMAAACDLDHRTDWDAGGTTCGECLDCLCRRHHLLKHQGGWTHWRDPATGDSVWTDPSGTTHHRPATILPRAEPVDAPSPEPVPAVGPAVVAAGDEPPPF